ncbi:MAG: FlgD immunoglobulin-like domain containing protein [Myxococcota bacterium]
MDVNALSSMSPPRSDAPAGSSKLGKDEFLKLLMTQLGNQDPLSPMDGQAFVAQLAQFAQLELQQAASQQLDALLMAQASSNQLQATSLVGRDAVMKSDGFTWPDPALDPEGAQGVTLMGSVASAAAQVTAVITDASGKVVRRQSLGPEPGGSFTFTWDGRDEAGELAAPGDYTVSFVAADASGKPVEAQALTQSRVVGVSFETGFAELLLSNGKRVRLADVLRITEAS